MKQVIYCLIVIWVDVVISLSLTSAELNDAFMDIIKEVASQIKSENGLNKELLSESGALKSALQKHSEKITNIKEASLLLKMNRSKTGVSNPIIY